MNIAELQGEKTIKTLAKRLLAEPSKDTPKTTQAEMEASLLRLNPQLANIGDLEKGAAIVVPDGFGLDPAQSSTPLRGLADVLLQRAESALADLRTTLKEQAVQQAERTERVQAWLKNDEAKDLGKQSPELKAVFTDATSAVKVLPKEQDATVTAETKALDKVEAEVKVFRTTNLTTTPAIGSGSLTKPKP
jgi:hypothetical protein